jgi:hypothetical protein
MGDVAAVNLPSLVNTLPTFNLDSLLPATDTAKFLGMMIAIGWMLFAADKYMKRVSL